METQKEDPRCEQRLEKCFCVDLGSEIALPIGDFAEWAAAFGIIEPSEA